MDVNFFTSWHNADQYPLLTAEEEIELAYRIKNNDQEARDKMIYSNLRLVVSIAKKYQNYGISLEDLIEEGILGLVRAVDAFEPEQECRLSTYATWKIKQTIRKAISYKSKNIHIPVHMYKLMQEWRNCKQKLSQEFCREPTEDEIGEKLNIHGRKRRFLLQAMSSLVVKNTSDILSDADIDEKDLYDGRIHDIFDQETEVTYINTILNRLTEREENIIRLRYGYRKDGTLQKPKIIAEILSSKEVNLTGERIRQIEREALKKLKIILKQDEKSPFHI